LCTPHEILSKRHEPPTPLRKQCYFERFRQIFRFWQSTIFFENTISCKSFHLKSEINLIFNENSILWFFPMLSRAIKAAVRPVQQKCNKKSSLTEHALILGFGAGWIFFASKIFWIILNIHFMGNFNNFESFQVPKQFNIHD